MSPKTEDKPEPVSCPFCDQSAETRGHVVVDGSVKACPHIDMIVGGEHLGGMR
jgi:hypothetical protein